MIVVLYIRFMTQAGTQPSRLSQPSISPLPRAIVSLDVLKAQSHCRSQMTIWFSRSSMARATCSSGLKNSPLIPIILALGKSIAIVPKQAPAAQSKPTNLPREIWNNHLDREDIVSKCDRGLSEHVQTIYLLNVPVLFVRDISSVWSRRFSPSEADSHFACEYHDFERVFRTEQHALDR